MSEWLNQATQNLTAEQIEAVITAYWLLPVGMVALYFYGNFHFNTPDYRLVILQGPEKPSLLTLAPPKFTTSRTRFRRYALRYVLILEVAFLSFVFFTSIYIAAAKLLGVDTSGYHFDTASLQNKVLFALFFLTGLLSSFPIFKEIDSVILRYLHQIALIPDDAKLMARRLFDVKYRPSQKTREAVRQVLISRDTMRFADGEIDGDLERRVVSLLWLADQLKAKSVETGCEYFAVRFEIDLADVAKTFDRMRAELVAYFRDQTALVPVTANDGSKVADIDRYLFDHSTDPAVAQLKERRDRLQADCDNLYYRICLLTSVLAYSSESNADQIGRLLSSLGFPVKVASKPIMDWDAVLRVVMSVFALTAAVHMIFAGLTMMFGVQRPAGGGNPLLFITLMTTLQYLVVIYVALKLKRYWNGHPPANQQIENPLIALLSYGLALLLWLGIWLQFPPPGDDFKFGPFLFALNQGVVGYFIANYVDRSLAEKPSFSWRIAALQGACQAIAALLIFYFVPPPHLTTDQMVAFGMFFVCQAGISGFLVGVIFQYFYRRTGTPRGDVVGDMTVLELPTAA